MKPKIFFVSLGCDKNFVDSETMLGLIDQAGMTITSEEEEAEVIIVNTCSFIHDAKQESIDTILEMAEYKKTGKLKGLIVTGCLPERYREEFMQELPEVDGVLGASNYDEIIETIEKVLEKERVVSFKDINYTPVSSKRLMSSTTAYGYLKISEGCNNHCTYCIIPSLRGRMRSRTLESLMEEARMLVAEGKKEIILVAQDTTKYGIDLYGERKLPELLKMLAGIPDLWKLRLLYCYPEDISDELIEVMKTEEKIAHYIDIPVQHINDTILHNMARLSSHDTVVKVIEKLKKNIPDICIRSTLIVGFPGETKEQFQELKDFVLAAHIDRMGVFTYSLEEGTKAALMDNQIDQEIKEARRDELMAIQQEISTTNNQEMIGRQVEVLIEGYIPDDLVYCGRCYKDAPSVDSMVFIENDGNYDFILGQVVLVRIIDANEYDLIGVIDNESCE